MIDIRAYHKFNFFGPIAAIEPTPENITKYISAFSFLGLVPNTVQQVEIQGNNQNGLIEGSRVKQRLQFISQGIQRWVVEVVDGNFSITLVRDEEGKLEDRNEFFANVLQIVEKLTDNFSIKAQRISYLTKALDSEEDLEKLDKANSNLINLPKLYTENSPFEWNTRNVAEVTTDLGSNEEKVNIITNINRTSGLFRYTSEPYDRIEIEFDINTSHKTKELRLGQEHIKDFSVYVDKLIPEMEKECLEILHK